MTPLSVPASGPEREQERAAKETELRGMSREELVALYKATRKAAALAHWAQDKNTLRPLVRGMKLLQMIADEKGFFIRTRKLQPPVIRQSSLKRSPRG